MNKLVFVLGMRRSGTSLLRKLVEMHPEVEKIEFEPNELLEICERIDIPRYKNIPYFNEVINRFKNHKCWYGAKLALNPGIEAMRWKNFDKQFDKPYYIFIRRNLNMTYQSWITIETSLRGVCDKDLYIPWWEHINNSFKLFVKENPNRSCIIQYEDLCKDADYEMKKIYDLLKIQHYAGFQGLIRRTQ